MVLRDRALVMILLFSRIPLPSSAFSTLAKNRPPQRLLVPAISFVQTRLYASKTPNVEVSPSNHGTTPLTSSFGSDQTKLDPRLARALRLQNITTPTPIQAHGIPLLREGHDVMGSAQTGTGKTLMFAIPLCERLLQQQHLSKTTSGNDDHKKGQRRRRPPSALILNPTRELAMQTASSLEKLTSNTPLKVALATGGESVGKQRKHLNSCDILVGTPGRILQFVDERTLSLTSMTNVVVDEADRMLDLGFEPDLRRIARALGKRHRDERRTVLCSATFPPDVQRVASEFLKQNYYFAAAGRVGATHEGIVQTLKWVNGQEQRRHTALQQVHSFLQSKRGSQQQQQRVIVFCNTKDEAERVGTAIKGPSVRVVTGDKLQSERNKSLDAFRKGKVQVLVATDVAARGLDVDNVGLVVQADAPRDIDTFVHRIGRTGRAGAKGLAVSLLDGRSTGIAPSLVELMHEANQSVPAWLLGMSYVSRARALEEEGAIFAGGGGSFGSVTSTLNEDSDEAFSAQDFRSSADAGSWGSERDTTYHSFDEDAYLNVDAFSSTYDSIPVTDQNVGKKQFRSEQTKGAQERNFSRSMSFERQNPSRELRSVLKRISRTDKVGSTPSRNVFAALSRRGEDQRLRLEYLGMFPFHEASTLLLTRESERVDRNSDLPRLLMVAEKPSIAKAISEALCGRRGARQKRGISRALPVYEFTSDQFVPIKADGTRGKAIRCNVIVTSVVGHVFSLGFVEEEGNAAALSDPSEYFRLPIVKQEEGSTGKLRVVDHLRALAGQADHLILWLDCDNEGENIAYEVIAVTRRALEQKMAEEMNANPGSSPTRRIYRARFSAITKHALQDAFSDLVEPDALLSQSVDARQELDLRVGVALSRLLSWRCVGLARKKVSPAVKFLSYGPCQTPTLSFCVDRAREIENFCPRDYWKVHISVDSPSESKRELKLRWIPPKGSEVESDRGRRRMGKGDKTKHDGIEESASFDKAAVLDVVKLASATESFATIKHVEHISERMRPPLGLNTVGLLAAGSKTMGMSPKKVMKVAEKLYSAGFISYPRTETTRYDPKGFDVQSTLREHASHPEWGRTASYLLRTKYSKSSRPPLRGHDAGDHPPITCVKVATREEVGGGVAWRVYEFISRNFLASLSDDLKFTKRVAELRVNGANHHHFELETVHVDSLGFSGACPWVLRDIGADKSSQERGSDSERFREGMRFSVVNSRSEVCATRPPRFLQEHELIELMDQHRIGTDASMATHVNNIIERGYVVLCDETGVPLRPPRPPRPGQRQPPRQVGRYLVPTSLGTGILSLFFDSNSRLDSISQDESLALLSRPAIRAQMEEEVRQIALGKLEKSECVEQNLAWFEARYKELSASLTRDRLNALSGSLCPTTDVLRYWKRIGAFDAQEVSEPQSSRRGWQSRGKLKSYSNSKGRTQRGRRRQGPRMLSKQEARSQ